MWERGWWQRLPIGPYSSGAMPHRTDNKRRGNSLPREGLQLCVAPYFAYGCRRHAGTVAVHRENATPEAVAGRHRTTQRPDKQCNICYTTADATAPHPSGVRFGGCPSAVPACRHDPAWRNTGLRTAATPRGVAEMSASGHHLLRWRRLTHRRCAALAAHHPHSHALLSQRTHHRPTRCSHSATRHRPIRPISRALPKQRTHLLALLAANLSITALTKLCRDR